MRLLGVFLLLLLNSLYSTAKESFTVFTQNGKVGLKNQSGEVVIPPAYEALGWSDGSFSIAGIVTGYKLHGTWGVVSIKNERITPPAYSSLAPADGNLLVATKESKLLQVQAGCINTHGETIIPFMYTGVKVHDLRAIAFVREGNLFKHGLIDLENKVIIPFFYKNIYPLGSLRYAVEDFNGKMAIFSDTGRQISGFTIDSLSHFSHDLAILYEGTKQGLITRNGELRSEAKYRSIEFKESNLRTRMPDQWHVVTGDNALQQIIEADSISLIETGRYKLQHADRSWLTDGDFNKLHQETYPFIGNFKKGLAVFQSGSQYGVIRKNGSVLLPSSFQKIVLGTDYILGQEKKVDRVSWVLYDTAGQRKTSKFYDDMREKMGSIFPVKKNGYWGGIDDYGREIIACVYDTLFESIHQQVNVQFKGKHGIISTKEEWLAYPQRNPITLLNQDRYFKRDEHALYLCTFTGMVVYFTSNPIQVKEDHVVEFVSSGSTWKIDFDGRIIARELPPLEVTEEIFLSSEGLRGIKKNGKYGFIDDQGRLRVANRYEGIKPFSEGLAAVKIRNKWGFINRDEKLMIQPVYEEVTPFENGYSIVKQNNLTGLINREGVLVLPVRYETFDIQDNGRIKVSVNGLAGLADAHGNILLQPKYESIQDLNNGFVIIKQHGKYGLVTLQGISTIPLLYDTLLYDTSRNRYLALKKSEWVEVRY